MAHPAYLREKARALRIERKLTIDELAERLALSRSTIYYWVRDLPIPGSASGGGPGGGWPASAHAAAARANRGRRRGNRAMQEKYRLLREAAYRKGRAEYGWLISEPGFRDFVCLYIAEGYKRDRNVVSICNSDVVVMQLALSWIRRLTSKPASFSIQYHADQDLGALRAFWGAALGCNGDRIRLQRKSNSGKLAGRQWRCRHGVLNVTVSDTYLRARLQAWIDQLRDEWGRQAALNSRGYGA
jgi:excisionase family DNA binding protein